MSIIFPMVLMALLTLGYMPLILFARIKAVRLGEVPLKFFATFQGGEPPARVAKTTRHLAHMIIHTGYNNIRHRMLVFLASCLVLAAIWIGIALIAIG